MTALRLKWKEEPHAYRAHPEPGLPLVVWWESSKAQWAAKVGSLDGRAQFKTARAAKVWAEARLLEIAKDIVKRLEQPVTPKKGG